MIPECTTDFDDWLVETFDRVGSFTLLIILIDIGETTVTLLASSYLHVIGNETRWADMIDLLSGAKVSWSGAVFFQGDRAGLIDDDTASQRLAELARHLHRDRSILSHGEFFSSHGLRMKIQTVDG